MSDTEYNDYDDNIYQVDDIYQDIVFEDKEKELERLQLLEQEKADIFEKQLDQFTNYAYELWMLVMVPFLQSSQQITNLTEYDFIKFYNFLLENN